MQSMDGLNKFQKFVPGSMDQKTFEYSRLPDGHIRLLKILRGENLSFEMEIHQIGRAPAYVALSYTWERQSSTQPINVDGRCCMIIENLHDALLILREEIQEKTGGLFWADAISINQEDDADKSSQVALMTQIYRRASFVSVWLGVPANGSDLAMQKMREIYAYFSKLLSENSGSFAAAMTHISPKNEALFGGPSPEAAGFRHAISRLLQRNWFTRAWVIQEISLNNHVYIFCGRQGIKWDILSRTLLVRMRLAEFPAPKHAFRTYNDGHPKRLDDIRYHVIKKKGYQLLKALQLLRMSKCEMGHDKVYAALGLTKDLSAGAIEPDYSKSTVEVYIDIVRYCLESAAAGHRLDFLGMVIRPAPDSKKLHAGVFKRWRDTEGEETPTWIPDWRQMVGFRPLLKTFGADDSSEGTVYNASRYSEPDISIEGRRLFVKGMYVDSIAHVSSITEEFDLNFTVQKSWTPDPPGAEYPTGETAQEAFLHTLITDVKCGNNLVADYRGYAVDWSVVEDPKTGVDDREWILERRNLRISISEATYLHRLIWTQKGFMGLAPAAAAVGDKICVLFGGQVLYVLRQVDDWATHEFMGESYVHGLMDGEALDMPSQGQEPRPEAEIFTIV